MREWYPFWFPLFQFWSVWHIWCATVSRSIKTDVGRSECGDLCQRAGRSWHVSNVSNESTVLSTNMRALCCPPSENRTCPLSSNVSVQLQDVQNTSNTMSIARCNVSDDEHNVTDASVQSSCSHMNWSESSDHSVFTAVERQWFHCCRETMISLLSRDNDETTFPLSSLHGPSYPQSPRPNEIRRTWYSSFWERCRWGIDFSEWQLGDGSHCCQNLCKCEPYWPAAARILDLCKCATITTFHHSSAKGTYNFFSQIGIIHFGTIKSWLAVREFLKFRSATPTPVRFLNEMWSTDNVQSNSNSLSWSLAPKLCCGWPLPWLTRAHPHLLTYLP